MIRPYEPRDLGAIMEIGDRAFRGIFQWLRRACARAVFDLRHEQLTFYARLQGLGQAEGRS